MSLGFGLLSFLPMGDTARHHVKRITALAVAAICILPLLGKAEGILDGTDLPNVDPNTEGTINCGENEVAELVITRAESDIESYLAEKGIYLSVDIEFSRTTENEYLIKSVIIRSKKALSSLTMSEIKTYIFEYLGYNGVEILFTEG